MANNFIPKEVLAFLQRKKLKPTDHWTDLWHGEHARYFTVARSTYADIVNDVYDEVVKAIADGNWEHNLMSSFKNYKRTISEIGRAHV